MVRTAVLTLWLLALTAPVALAAPGQDQGNGWYVPANDKVVTNAGFILIAFFPLFILLMSLLQWRLDKRKQARKAAAKGRAGSKVWTSGW
jgi:preprotein translocase subunit YajC